MKPNISGKTTFQLSTLLKCFLSSRRKKNLTEKWIQADLSHAHNSYKLAPMHFPVQYEHHLWELNLLNANQNLPLFLCGLPDNFT